MTMFSESPLEMTMNSARHNSHIQIQEVCDENDYPNPRKEFGISLRITRNQYIKRYGEVAEEYSPHTEHIMIISLFEIGYLFGDIGVQINIY